MPIYPGGKNLDGAYQRLINLIPPHAVYIETHLGSGALLRHKRPANRNIAIDLDPVVIDSYDDPIGTTELLCEDALTFLQSYNFTGSEFIYLDPPYLRRSSNRRRYRYEYTRRDHERLLDVLLALPCSVMISGYHTELYATKLNDWHTQTFPMQTHAGHAAEEWLWMNYPTPTELHDYRYLGNTFRERERIKRKQTRWVNKLAGMPLLERRALLAALTEVPLSPAVGQTTESPCVGDGFARTIAAAQMGHSAKVGSR